MYCTCTCTLCTCTCTVYYHNDDIVGCVSRCTRSWRTRPAGISPSPASSRVPLTTPSGAGAWTPAKEVKATHSQAHYCHWRMYIHVQCHVCGVCARNTLCLLSILPIAEGAGYIKNIYSKVRVTVIIVSVPYIAFLHQPTFIYHRRYFLSPPPTPPSHQELMKVIYADRDTSCLKDTSSAPGDASAVADTTRGVRCLQVCPSGQHLAAGDRIGNLKSVFTSAYHDALRVKEHYI